MLAHIIRSMCRSLHDDVWLCINCFFDKTDPMIPNRWLLWGLEWMDWGIQLTLEACPSIAIYIHKANGPYQHISSDPWMCGLFVVHCFLPKTVPTQPSTDYCEAWKGWIQAYSPCLKIVNPLSNTNKANGPCQQISSGLWKHIFSPWCVVPWYSDSLLLPQTAWKQFIHWLLWGLEVMDQDMQLMLETCQSFAIYP